MQNCNKPPVNMRRTLRMMDGGEIHADVGGMWESLKRTATGRPPETLSEQYARKDAARAASRPAPAAAPALPAPTPMHASGISGYVGNSALQRREAAAGLRDGGDLRTGHGGEVPGKGKGDKIPALYEPSEFVVSNDMLDAAPGLREQLHDLRGNVLAEKGMTPEQADAKALSGTGLRARYGFDDLGEPLGQAEPAPGQRAVAAPAAPKYTLPPVDSTTGRYAHEVQTGQRPVVASAPGAMDSAGGHTRGVALPNEAAGVKQSLWGKTKAAGGAALDGAKSIASGKFLNADVGAMAGKTLRGGLSVGRSILESPFTPAGLAIGAGAAAAQGFVTDTDEYRLRAGADPSGSTAGDVAARGAGVLADFGDFITYGGATRLGNYLTGKGFNPNNPDGSAPGEATPTAPQPNTPTQRPTNRMGQGYDDPRLVNADPSRATLRESRDFTSELGAVPKNLPADLREGVIHKTVGPNGNPVYSGRNVSGDAQFVDGKGAAIGSRGGVTSLPGMPQAQIDAALTNPDGSTWTARDNAVMAANLRDGADPYRGTSRQPQNDEHAQVRALANSPVGTIGRRGAMKRLSEIEQNQTTLRGQDQEMERAKLTAQSTLRKNEFDMQRDLRTDTRAQEAHNQTVGDKAREGLAKEFMVYDTDKDGRQVANPKASTESLDALRAILPGMTSTDPKTREAALSDAKAMHRIFLKARKQDPVGWDAMKFWEPARPELSGMPDATGSSTEQLSGMDGLMTANAENGDTILRQKDGRKINLGQLDARQRKLLEAAQQRGWGK